MKTAYRNTAMKQREGNLNLIQTQFLIKIGASNFLGIFIMNDNWRLMKKCLLIVHVNKVINHKIIL